MSNPERIDLRIPHSGGSNIYLVGFMATGKTETAKLLAKRLKRQYLDMDEIIEGRQKSSIPEIFKSKGE